VIPLLLAAALCTGTISFQPPARYEVSAVRALLVRDLDGDGALDIITSGNQVDEADAFSLLVNRGAGTFAPQRLVPSTFGEEVRDAADIDGDGIVDLAVSNYWANGIATYRGKGAFAFEPEVAYGTATHGGPTLIADINGDGKQDIVSFSFGSGNPVRVHLFEAPIVTKKTFDTTFAVADSQSTRLFNGALEVLADERSSHLGIFRIANGNVTTTRIATPARAGFDFSSRFVDVNGDGIADIVVITDAAGASEPLFVALGKADGTFGEWRQSERPRHLDELGVAIRGGDVDGDGHADLIVRDFGASHVLFCRGDGTGRFGEAVAVDTGGVVNDVAIADVNGDGRPDIVTLNDDHHVSVIVNGGPCVPARRRAVRR